jgi:hypothetical protein
MFEVGDRVRIREDSSYYGRDVKTNPADVDGVVIRVDGFALYVKWDTGYRNTYYRHSLEYAKTLEELMEEYLCQS